MNASVAIRCLAPILIGAAAPAVFAAGAPAPGDVYIYHLINGYNKEVLSVIRHRVENVERAAITLSVTPDNAEGGVARTEIVTREGNWLQTVMESHDQKVEYVFATAYPAYVFPLDVGKSWSVRVPATVSATGQRRSVRVDGRVLGTERIRVPAGEFDTVKVRRYVYPGDADYYLPETAVTEVEWYVPALGRAVRTERRSEYQDLNSCHEDSPCIDNGAWDVFELVQAPGTSKPGLN
ncbi:MAG: hypothetical protein HYY78_13645 [Betaproteobacteria bacterium]|nr:hypothetical protein [Betaproteobacteria bacterium]